jgi:hypothetical protein
MVLTHLDIGQEMVNRVTDLVVVDQDQDQVLMVRIHLDIDLAMMALNIDLKCPLVLITI